MGVTARLIAAFNIIQKKNRGDKIVAFIFLPFKFPSSLYCFYFSVSIIWISCLIFFSSLLSLDSFGKNLVHKKPFQVT